jgi:hypothetical protein
MVFDNFPDPTTNIFILSILHNVQLLLSGSDLLSVRSLKLILPKKITSGYYCRPCEFWLSLKNTFSITYPNPTPKV